MSPKHTNPLRARLDALTQIAPKRGVACWSARDLCEPLGYAKWERFLAVVERAIGARKDAGLVTRYYFRELTTTNADGLIVVNDYRLTRLACHLVTLAADSRKKAVVDARAYFAEPQAAAKPAAKPKSKPAAKKAAVKAPKPGKPAVKSAAKTKTVAGKAAPAAPKVATAKTKAVVKPLSASGSRFIPQVGDKFYGSTHASRNSRWNPNCAVSRGYHNRAAANGR